MMDISKIREEAVKELTEEKSKIAKEAIKGLYRKLDAAKKVVHNIEQEIADTLVNIENS